MQLGHVNPYEMAEKMPVWLLREWQAYFDIEPFGAWRDNYHMAVRASQYHNWHCSKKSDMKSPSEFMYMDARTQKQRNQKLSQLKTLSFIDRMRAAAQRQE